MIVVFLAKQFRLQFPSSFSTSEHLFHIVHADLLGPYRFKTHGQCNMFFTLMEDKSRCTWVYLLSDKSTVPILLREYILLIQNQFQTTIKVLRIDNGYEFMNLLTDLGIIHQSCFCIRHNRMA